MMRELRDLEADRLKIRLPEEFLRLTRPDQKKSRKVQQLPTAGVPMTPPPLKHAPPVAMHRAMGHFPRKVAP